MNPEARIEFDPTVINVILFRRGVRTARALAAEIGVGELAISRWKRGHYQPSADALLRMMKLYDLTLDELTRPTTTATEA